MDFHPMSLCICSKFGHEAQQRVLEQCASVMNNSRQVCDDDVDNIIICGSDARVSVLNSALQVIWVACGTVSKPLAISLFSVRWQRLYALVNCLHALY
jgi:hypothetical protein